MSPCVKQIEVFLRNSQRSGKIVLGSTYGAAESCSPGQGLLVCPAGRGGRSEEAKKYLAKSRAAAL